MYKKYRKSTANITHRKLEALDTVLFCGNDPVSSFISKVESVFVVPSLGSKQRFHKLWTHSGILVDKNVLPLDCLEDNKLYLFESILCGNILGIYEYSRILCVDHPVSQTLGFYIGPQIREWVPVVDEVVGDVAVLKLNPAERDRLLSDLDSTRHRLLAFYAAHQHWGYPLIPLPQFAAASQDLYSSVVRMRERLASIPAVGNLLSQPSKEIFCSEMVAKLYGQLDVAGFSEDRPPENSKRLEYDEFTPLHLEVADALSGGAAGGSVVYAKLRGRILLDLEEDDSGRKVVIIDSDFQEQSFPFLKITNDNWHPVRNNKLSPFAVPFGYTVDGTPTFISRCQIGETLQIGYTTAKGIMTANWEGLELPIEYDHEVLILADSSEYEWVQSGKLLMGAVPRQAISGGCDAYGNQHYIARTRLMDPGSLGLGALVIGRVAPSLGGARFTHAGKEVSKYGDYEVLCKRTHFLDRVFFGLGAEHYLVFVVIMFFYFLGTIRIHEAILAIVFARR